MKDILRISGLVLIIPFIQSCSMGFDNTIRDIEGNFYTTVNIGTQVWMVENLKVTKYRNGDPIPNVTDNNLWNELTKDAYCNYDNDTSNVSNYGRLYNWYAVNDNRKIAPAGWHVPSDEEWAVLGAYLGGNNVAGGKMKEADKRQLTKILYSRLSESSPEVYSLVLTHIERSFRSREKAVIKKSQTLSKHW